MSPSSMTVHYSATKLQAGSVGLSPGLQPLFHLAEKNSKFMRPDRKRAQEGALCYCLVLKLQKSWEAWILVLAPRTTPILWIMQ